MYLSWIQKIKVLLFVAGPLLFISCKNQAGGQGSSVGSVPEDLVVEVYHQGCRGYCPDYFLKVNAVGKVEYEGRRAVDLLGKYQKSISQDRVAEIWKAIEEADFWSFEDEYGTEVADLPEVHTTVIANGQKKRTRNVRNGPEALSRLEKRIEDLIGMDGLKQVQD